MEREIRQNLQLLKNLVQVYITDMGDKLVAWWNFDEGQNTTAADSSGNRYTGTLINGAIWVKGEIGPYAVSTDTGNPSSQITVPSVPLGSAWTATWWSYFPLATFNNVGGPCSGRLLVVDKIIKSLSIQVVIWECTTMILVLDSIQIQSNIT